MDIQIFGALLFISFQCDHVGLFLFSFLFFFFLFFFMEYEGEGRAGERGLFLKATVPSLFEFG